MSRLNERDGFTILELMATIITIAILITAAVFLWYNASRGTDIKAAAQMIKEDLVKAAGMADSGNRVVPTQDPNAPRDRYRVVFKAAGSPANTYKIMKGAWTPSTGSWSWTDVPLQKGTYNKVAAGTWIQAGGSTDIQVTPNFLTSSEYKAITFISTGSVIRAIQADNPLTDNSNIVGPPLTLTVSSSSGSGPTRTITISSLGDVQIK